MSNLKSNKCTDKYGPQNECFRNCGIFTNIRPILQPPVETRFQTIINDLKETTYKSYWNSEIGKPKDTTGKLPLKVDPYSTTFGKKTKRDLSVKDLITNAIYDNEMSKSKEYEEYCCRKDMRKLSIKPTGKKEKLYNPHQSIVKCCMEWKPFDIACIANSTQADFLNKYSAKLGQSRTAFEFPPYGIEYKPLPKFYYGVTEFYKEDYMAKKICENYMSYINAFRLKIKDRCCQHSFDLWMVYSALKYYDKDNIEWIPYSTVCKVCADYKIVFDKNIMAAFLEAANILKADHIHYRKFVDILNWKVNFPVINLKYFPQKDSTL